MSQSLIRLQPGGYSLSPTGPLVTVNLVFLDATQPWPEGFCHAANLPPPLVEALRFTFQSISLVHSTCEQWAQVILVHAS